jgi:hypothetical protein
MKDEFEDRRRKIDAEYLAALEMLREGHRLRLCELDKLRSARAEESARPVSVQPASAPPPSVAAAVEPGQPASPSPPPAPSAWTPPRPPGRPPRIPRRSRKLAAEVQRDLTLALPDLPEVFGNQDIYLALGYKPSRSTLGRAITPLMEEGYFVLEEAASGRQSNIYRRTMSEARLEFLRQRKRGDVAAELTSPLKYLGDNRDAPAEA